MGLSFPHASPLARPLSQATPALELRLAWSAERAGARYAEAVLSLFGGAAELTVETRAGRRGVALEPAEARRHLLAGARALSLRLHDTPDVRLELALGPQLGLRLVGAELDEDSFPASEPRWLQADPEITCPWPTLALPWPDRTVHEAFFHALVALAAAISPLEQASLRGASGPLVRAWSVRPEGDPVIALAAGALWMRGPSSPEGAPPTLWVTPARASEERAPPTLVEVQRLLSQEPPDLEGLRNTLALFVGPFTRLELRRVSEPCPARFHQPPPPHAALRLIPEPDRVVLEIDEALPPDRAAVALLHGAGHLALGHVRAGDPVGHWDTLETIRQLSRRWDREVREAFPSISPPEAPRRSALAECTPLEKAWAVLHRHIRAMAGSGRPLHEAAERYQPAAYQRQAAQRLVSQLDEYDGAMLCDGVGLGKTYVATTVMVHYANRWRERLMERGLLAAADPFLVTVLTPNAVVSTWRREALPPLPGHGVPQAAVRVISHSKLSRVLPVSEVLERQDGQRSDLEHLLLSDLVIVDEAHNFRSVIARRTVVLRDLLRLQPRKDHRRKVLLLTATPVNNSLEDLRQQASLLFSKPLWFNANTTPEGYRARAVEDVSERADRARAWASNDDVMPILVFDDKDRKFSQAIEFRDDIQFGVLAPHLGEYLKEQARRLEDQRELIRLSMLTGTQPRSEPARIAAELLDRVVVQRSRALCKEIERQQGSEVQLLFRPDAGPPERLVYADEYDGFTDVLARFLPLFEAGEETGGALVSPLSLKIYMWADVRDGERDASEVSSVVGLQRVLVLKRLESSPVAFLITLLRLLVLHAHRLEQLRDLCHTVSDRERGQALDAHVTAVMSAIPEDALRRVELLATGRASTEPARGLLRRLSIAHKLLRKAADTDDPPPPQLDLFARDDVETATRREHLDRLWALEEDLVGDLRTLLAVVPDLTEIIFGRFAVADWPKRFIAGGESVDWPESTAWGLRLVNDAKLRRLVAALIRARADGQKVIVFSQFTDTLAYIGSVLRAMRSFGRNEWPVVLRDLGHEVGARVTEAQVRDLVDHSAVVSGATEDRDAVISAFAPFYRLGPTRPVQEGASAEEQQLLVDLWRQGWTRALAQPCDLLLATDVLAEGVNLQDASLLINYDIHWNPVRMIQRAGRVDRRLNPAIERADGFPDLDALAAELGLPAPRYWWHGRAQQAPVTVNLILPDALEEELQLREKIAQKTLAIDFTLGLEQGTGAEADWMASYRYRGISALNAWQRDRAIERVASYQERLRRLLEERGIDPDWIDRWNGWLRERGAGPDAPVLAWALLGQRGGEVSPYSRSLRPVLADGVPWWLWTTAKPGLSLLNLWLGLDGRTFPPPARKDLPWSEDASRPVSAEDLLGLAQRLTEQAPELDELKDVGRLVQQGATAISAGFLSTEHHRLNIKVGAVRLLQLQSFSPLESPC